MRKIAFVLMAAIAVFSVLAWRREVKLVADAKAEAEAAAALGNRPGGIIINIPSFAPPAGVPADAPAAQTAAPASSGESCP